MLVVQWNTRNITEKKTITISITDLEADPHFYKSIHPSKSFNLPNSQCIISYIKISLQHIWYNACDYLLACVVCWLLIVERNQLWLTNNIMYAAYLIQCMRLFACLCCLLIVDCWKKSALAYKQYYVWYNSLGCEGRAIFLVFSAAHFQTCYSYCTFQSCMS